jgi:hypothetical protein
MSGTGKGGLDGATGGGLYSAGPDENIGASAWPEMKATPISAHPYNRRSVKSRIEEERAYHVSMSKMMYDRRHFNLSYSHLLYADELKSIGETFKRERLN